MVLLEVEEYLKVIGDIFGFVCFFYEWGMFVYYGGDYEIFEIFVDVVIE